VYLHLYSPEPLVANLRPYLVSISDIGSTGKMALVGCLAIAIASSFVCGIVGGVYYEICAHPVNNCDWVRIYNMLQYPQKVRQLGSGSCLGGSTIRAASRIYGPSLVEISAESGPASETSTFSVQGARESRD
jgi:hypothetical protein